MTDQKSSPYTRRRFVKLLGAGAVVTPLAGLGACSGEDSSSSSQPASPPPADSGGSSTPDPAPAAGPEPTPEPAPSAPPTEADGLPRLSESDPQAVALGYKHDAADVEADKFPRFEAGQLCSTCALYQGGDNEWGPCAIFPGRDVAAAGWCSAFAPKT